MADGQACQTWLRGDQVGQHRAMLQCNMAGRLVHNNNVQCIKKLFVMNQWVSLQMYKKNVLGADWPFVTH